MYSFNHYVNLCKQDVKTTWLTIIKIYEHKYNFYSLIDITLGTRVMSIWELST